MTTETIAATTAKPRRKQKPKFKLFTQRSFLNIIPSSPACIIVELEHHSYTNPSDDANGDYSIKINDCQNRVTLHGNLNNPEKRRNAIFKLNMLIEHCTMLRNKIIEDCIKHNLKY